MYQGFFCISVNFTDSCAFLWSANRMTDIKNIGSEDQNPPEQVKSIKSRRSFLKKATIGATIASIPAHSVWAGRLISGNMSGNVSQFASERPLAILSHGYYKKKRRSVSGRDMTFSQAFGAEPIPNQGYPAMPTGLTLLDVMQNWKIKGEGGNKTGGPGNVNMQLATMYLNAYHDGGLTSWPVVDSFNGPFFSLSSYASYLYSQALLNPTNVGNQLGLIIDTHHA